MKENQLITCGKCIRHDNCSRRGALCEDFVGLDGRALKDVKQHPNQKAKSDAGKPRLTLVPRRILTAIARIREYGNAKYPDGGPDNYKTVGVERYRDALFRHLIAYLDDPYGVDEESKLPHLWHLACNVAFLCELEDEEIKKGMEK